MTPTSERSVVTLSESTSFALDGVRVVTSQAVVLGHAMSFFGVLTGVQPPHFPAIQELGVVVFFALSGFLIAYTTDAKSRRASTYGFREYFIDRFARIYSGYLPALALIALVDGWRVATHDPTYTHHEAFDLVTGIGNVLMLETHTLLHWVHRIVPAIPMIDRFGSGRPLWTLAIEWWIYMLFGWAVLGNAVRRKRPLFFWAVLALFAAVPMWNAFTGYGEGIATVWILGAVGFLLVARVEIGTAYTWGSCAAGAGGLALVRCFVVNGKAYDGILVTLISLSVVAAILALQRSTWKPPALLRNGARFAADYSFTLYLVHYTVLELFLRFEGRVSGSALLAAGFIASNVVAAAVAVPTEMRHRKFAAFLHARLGAIGSGRTL